MEVNIDGVRYVPQIARPKAGLPFGVLLRQARDLKGESLEEAASHLSISKMQLWHMENEQAYPRLPVLFTMLKYYGIDFNDIRPPEEV